jgi:hypothetical protein
MRDLDRYGIADKWPKLTAMRQEVADLEARRGEAEAAVVAAREAIGTAQEQDAEAASKAIRAGKSVPDGKHERKVLAALEDAQRNLAAYARAATDAQADLARFTAKHRAEIRADILGALREKARRLNEHATEAAQLYATIADSQYDLKELTPAPPPDEPAGTGQNMVDIINVTRQSFGPNRGDVEGALSYLAGLVNQYQEPAPKPAAVTEEAGAA